MKINGNIWFTSDLHFGDDRITLYARDIFFKSIEDFEHKVIFNWRNKVEEKDTVYVLGDVAFTPLSCLKIKELPGKKILIRGNYDRADMTAKDDVVRYLPEIFEEIYDDLLLELGGKIFYLNHFPDKCSEELFNITGHVHGCWRFQRNMINVSIDAWNFHLLDKNRLLFFYNNIKKYYDINVFAGELKCNKIFN